MGLLICMTEAPYLFHTQGFPPYFRLIKETCIQMYSELHKTLV